MPAAAAARIAQWSLDHQVYAEFAVGSDFLVSDRREAARPAFDDIAGGPDGVVADVDLTAAETFKITIYAFEQEHGPAASPSARSSACTSTPRRLRSSPA